ncbi:3'-5' exonuclease [Helicobacter sp. MIT 99-5507]|uniref:3'-5' exonuclease n=1 Tax=Helicobacter sp. MIT 99-5507 TaxID=152489 RepID=UPI000E1EC501|nr:3'-5' exonuclease [Helicobacter sp. MIT 99-5507]RDU57481.1 3'-5' exonuclease [Helicobacter sp. MIT 99-5507]
MICVFDCESIPDVELLREVYDYKGSDIDVCEIAFKTQESINGSSFLPLPFHKIISLSAVICDENCNFIKVVNYKEGLSEQEIISDFLHYFNKHNPKLVSFNGRNFDIPLIMLRAMKYNLNASAYFEIQNPKYNKSKWENYRSRYSENFHIDLLDCLGSFGAVRAMRLDIVCKMANIPGKFDTSGDDVFRLYYENKIQQINDYCQSDVLNTYWLFLKYLLLQDKINIEDYANLLNVFFDKIPQNKNYTDIFKDYITQELNRL